MPKKRRKSRRSKTKYAALDPALNLKTRYEEIEDLASYAHTLKDEKVRHCNKPECEICADPKTRYVNPLEWLNKFAEESINADFRDKGKKLHTKKKQRREVYNRNNARNRCIMTQVKAYGKLIDLDNLPDSTFQEESFEDQVLTKIDLEKLDKLKKTKNGKNRKKRS